MKRIPLDQLKENLRIAYRDNPQANGYRSETCGENNFAYTLSVAYTNAKASELARLFDACKGDWDEITSLSRQAHKVGREVADAIYDVLERLVEQKGIGALARQMRRFMKRADVQELRDFSTYLEIITDQVTDISKLHGLLDMDMVYRDPQKGIPRKLNSMLVEAQKLQG